MASLSAVAALMGASRPATATQADAATAATLAALASRFPPLYPQFAIALEVLAEVGETIEAGPGPYGGRRIVPITGGAFRGPGIAGRVLPGGADRQTIRADGVRQLDAIYELQADDGAILMVRNQVLIDAVSPPEGYDRYARSVVQVNAPDGPHGWLNRRILVGTLDSLRPAEPRVFLRFFILR